MEIRENNAYRIMNLLELLESEQYSKYLVHIDTNIIYESIALYLVQLYDKIDQINELEKQVILRTLKNEKIKKFIINERVIEDMIESIVLSEVEFVKEEEIGNIGKIYQDLGTLSLPNKTNQSIRR